MTPKPYHCRHIFTDGHQCGSPALRGEPLCFYHHAARRPDQLQTIAGQARVALPDPTDLHAVQRGLVELLRLASTGLIDDKQARTLLRILATASSTLARIDRQTARALQADPARSPVQDYVLDPQRGTLAPEPVDEFAQPVAPQPRPEGPLPDPVTRLALAPAVELVKDPLFEAFKQQQAARQTEAMLHQREQARAARQAREAALTPAQRETQRQARRNRLPEAYRPIFDQLEAEQAAAEAETAATTTPTQPQTNQDFGLLRKHPSPEKEEHLACA